MRPDRSRAAYRGEALGVTVERWGERDREVVERPDAVAVIPVDRDGVVTLVRQRRESVRCELVELPAGVVDEGEKPLSAARRELEEETGLRVGRWRAAASVFSSPGFTRERIHLFFAEDVELGEAKPADDERIELVRWPVGELAERVREVQDAKTLAGLLLYLREAGRARPPG